MQREKKDEPKFDLNLQDENAIEEEEISFRDLDEALVLQSNLDISHEKEDEWLHHKNFHTRCTLWDTHSHACFLC